MRRIGRDLVVHATVRRLDETIGIGARIRRQRTDKTDVRSFRCLDGTDAPVMRMMNVAHVEAGALAGETAGSKRAQSPLVCEFCKRIGLIHELRKLAAAEELLHRSNDRTNVD